MFRGVGYLGERDVSVDTPDVSADRKRKVFILFYFKDLLQRNSLQYMWGYKIVPMTNLSH